MRVEYVNPFVESAVDVFRSVIGEKGEIKRGKLDSVTPPIVSNGVSVMIGVVGQIRGSVILDMRTLTALRISEAMSGEPVGAYGDMARAAISELSNWVNGHAIAGLVHAGYNVDITPPTLYEGKGVEIYEQGVFLVVPIDTPYNQVTLMIHLEEK